MARTRLPSLLLSALALLFSIIQVEAQGTLNIALQQQFAFTNCTVFSNACGTPLSGGLLYFYQVGTVATPQDSFQDAGLSLTNPWPLTLDASGRVPMFYLASGSVHARLTDSTGVVQFDIPSILVVGGTPSGGGGGGGVVDPTTVASTGDIKFRAGTEFLTGWVKSNGTTIGNALSGATQRANADTQNLFVWLWQNCPDAHCPVPTGRGANALADFNANKQITVIDLRGRAPFGLDDMGNTAAGRINAINMGAGDTPTTPQGVGGESLHTLSLGEIPPHRHSVELIDPGHGHGVTDPGHAHGFFAAHRGGTTGGLAYSGCSGANCGDDMNEVTNTAITGIAVQGNTTGTYVTDGAGNTNITGSAGSGNGANVMNPFLLGTWYLKQ